MATSGFQVSWEAGASAQIEIFSPGDREADSYRLKFTPPMRKTLRPPLSELTLGPNDLDPIRQNLKRLVGVVDARRAGLPAAAPPEDEVIELVETIGTMLFDFVVPDDVRDDLASSEVFLEVGMDEKLLELPWELLHDGEKFFCLKHAFGRFVNVTRPAPAIAKRPALPSGGPLSVLLISVPRPLPRQDGKTYRPLPGVEAETQAVIDALTGLDPPARIELLAGSDATFEAVYNTLKAQEQYHIVHFGGHAYFDDVRPQSSSLAFHDKDMGANQLYKFFARRPPVLFFMNACETGLAKPAEDEWKNRYDVFGLARAFLDTGAYLLGNRWEVGDASARIFADAFYSKLGSGKPLGDIIRSARQACYDAQGPGDFSWASYVFYGDPRVCFRPVAKDNDGGDT